MKETSIKFILVVTLILTMSNAIGMHIRAFKDQNTIENQQLQIDVLQGQLHELRK